MADRERSLADFVSSVTGDTYLKVEEHLGDGFVRLKTTEAERRQAKHDIQAVEDVVVEVLRNARDAESRRVFLASTREGDLRQLVCIDDGCGIPASMQQRVFEPRVTSKLDTMVMDRYGVHGRGMALFSIRSNVSQATVVASGVGRGTAVKVTADTAALSERKDQSTWPTLVEAADEADQTPDSGGEDSERLRGPRNIVRAACEFSLDYPDVEVWVGSPAEVAATMHGLAQDILGSGIVRSDGYGDLPLWQTLAGAADALDLVDRAAQLGIELSERHAHRVLGGEVRPVLPARRQLKRVAARETQEAARAGETPADLVDLTVDRRSLKPAPADLIALQASLAAAFDDFAKRYYLELKDLPRVHVGKREITVRFPVDKE